MPFTEARIAGMADQLSTEELQQVHAVVERILEERSSLGETGYREGERVVGDKQVDVVRRMARAGHTEADILTHLTPNLRCVIKWAVRNGGRGRTSQIGDRIALLIDPPV